MGSGTSTLLEPRLVPVRPKGNAYDLASTTFLRGVRARWLADFLAGFPRETKLADFRDNDFFDAVPADAKGRPQFILAYPEFLGDEITVLRTANELIKAPKDAFVWTRFACGVRHTDGDADYLHIEEHWQLAKNHLVFAKLSLGL
jgi:hypothetical protein